ncbi:hypothetical protein ILYODFUR_020227 [Ilyodon furcidens]|uniref:Uncharacterized protein n=1 Tax=Ilyodon furcidens TaxID=33524 RepID=A0ABV0V4L8_9TELE
MSYRYGGGGGGGRRSRKGGREYRDGSRERLDRGGGGGGGRGPRGHGSDFDQDGGAGGGQRDRPPPHLRGREIGLWYARYGAVRRKQADRRSRAVVHMDEAREEHITKLLNSVQNDQPGPMRDRRDAQSSMSDNWGTAAGSSGHCYFDGDMPEEEKHKSGEEEGDTSKEKKGSRSSQRGSSTAADKDEPPENWDEDDKDEAEKKKLIRNDKDLEFLFQEVVRDSSMDDDLKRDLQSKKTDLNYKEMLKFREKLPSHGKKEELVQLINSNRVLVVSGETGCGKTTQVTQFILDDHINRGRGSTCRVVCTQPRRISAISVAERVAAERAESVGNGNSCGYQIRLQR